MKIQNIRDLASKPNVCQQVLREVERQKRFSVAHVTMGPLAESLLHNHERTTELYIITKGFGVLGLGTADSFGSFLAVTAGSVREIPEHFPHMLRNLGAGTLEHLVIAMPPFDPADVRLFDGDDLPFEDKFPRLPPVEECFDGARIIPYTFPEFGLSVAFGFVTNESARRKRPHYHKETTEFVYVVEGEGMIVGGGRPRPICPGDWIRLDPGEAHAFEADRPEALVLVCISSPAFKTSEVHYQE